MKKILLLSLMALVLVACTSTEKENQDKMSRVSEAQWWEQAGELDSEYWWVSGDEDKTDSDSD